MVEWLPISELFEFEKGSLQSSKCTQGKYTFVTAAEEWKTHNSFTHDCEALIFAMAASGSLGRTHYIRSKFISSDLCFILTPKDDKKIDLPFYYRIFNFIREDIVKKTATGTSKLAINRTSFGNYSLPYFDFDHQILYREKIDKIVSIKESLVDGFTNQQKHLSLLRQSILHEAIEGKLTSEWRKKNPVRKGDPSTDVVFLLDKIRTEKQKLIAERKLKKEKPTAPIKPEEIPFDLPNGWAWCRLGEISSIVRGGSPRPAGDKRYYEGNIPFLKVADLTRDNNIYLSSHTYTIKEAGLHKTRFVESDTLMLTNSGATLGIPKICRFPTTFNDGIAAFLGLIDDFNKVFLYYFLKAKSQWFLAEAARGQGQPNLNTDIIGNTILALPPLAEQKVIVERVGRILGMVGELEQQVKDRQSQAEQLMQAVLREAFEGQ